MKISRRATPKSFLAELPYVRIRREECCSRSPASKLCGPESRSSDGSVSQFQGRCDFLLDGQVYNPICGKELLPAVLHPNRAEFSSHCQNFVSYQMKPDEFRSGTIKKECLRRFFRVGAQFIPGIALNENILCQAFGRVSSIGFLRDLKNQLIIVLDTHPFFLITKNIIRRGSAQCLIDSLIATISCLISLPEWAFDLLVWEQKYPATSGRIA